MFEFGEQVLAKPKRTHSASKKKSLDARFLEASWVGYSTRSNEHTVVLRDGGPAIKVSALRSRPEGERNPMLRTKGRHASPCPMTKGRKWEGLGFDLARRHQGREKGAQAQAREAVVSAGAWSRGITHGEGLLFSAMLVIGASSTAPRTALLAA